MTGPRYIVYGAVDPLTQELRYVGQTGRGLGTRICEHRYVARRGLRRHLYTWIRALSRLGLEPEWFVIESHDSEDESLAAERFWVAYFRTIGCRLTNATDGGETQKKVSAESRRKMSEARLGKPGHPVSQEHRQKLRDIFAGKPKTPEHRRKTAETSRSYWAKAESRLAASRARGGVPLMDELGRVYQTQREAGLALGISRSAVQALIEGRLKAAKGHTICRI